jgi:peptidoglycan/xylan/chitin deacetylase (PgdA/CDA1 family)
MIILLVVGLFSSLPIVTYSQSSSSNDSTISDQDNRNTTNNDNKFIILVFDRGYKSQFTNAKPILDKYGYKATVFAICNFIGNNIRGAESAMNWHEIETLHKKGYDIQSHGMNHKDLTSITLDGREFEVGESKQCLLDHGINSIIYSAAFNKGGDDPEIINIIAKYYDFSFNAHSTLMFLHCDGWEKFGFDEKNYKGQTDCRTYFDDGTPTPTNRYAIKEWSQDREHDRINDRWPDSPPHGPIISEILFNKFVEIVNSQTKFNVNGQINAIPIITYHNVNEDETVSTSEELFAREMKYLHDNGFQVITVSDLGYNEDENYFFIEQ